MEYYLDNAATTRISSEVFQDILPFIGTNFGNPSSLHRMGSQAKEALNKARKSVAKYINAKPEEIYFTSGGSEANTWTLMGLIPFLKEQKKTHIITSAIEHSSILETCKELEKQGFIITYIYPDTEGIISEKDIEERITPETGLVSIMSANNEIGTIQPVFKIGKICHTKGVLFHTDAVQALEDVRFNMSYNYIDLMSMSAHKVHGLKGCGALYIKKGISLSPLIFGGNQEQGLRSGTENVLGAISFGSALEHLSPIRDDKILRKTHLRNLLITKLSKVEGSYINGSKGKRLSGNINISFNGVEGESLGLRLSSKKIYLSTGSACHSGSLAPSHVLTAIGLEDNLARSAIRISLEDDLTEKDIDEIARVIVREVRFLRRLNQR